MNRVQGLGSREVTTVFGDYKSFGGASGGSRVRPWICSKGGNGLLLVSSIVVVIFFSVIRSLEIWGGGEGLRGLGSLVLGRACGVWMFRVQARGLRRM